MTDVPDFIPILGAGEHRGGPKTGACFMEFASFLAGEKWSDNPECANKMLAHVSITINDAVGDSARQRLLPLIPRVIGTAAWNTDSEVYDGMADFVRTMVRCEECRRVGCSHVDPFPRHPSEHGWGRIGVSLAGYGRNWLMFDNDRVNFLTQVYDEFDRLAGRRQIEPVTVETYRQFHDLINA